MGARQQPGHRAAAKSAGESAFFGFSPSVISVLLILVFCFLVSDF